MDYALDKYVRYLVNYHGYNRDEAEDIIEDVKGTIYWKMDQDENVIDYLHDLIIDLKMDITVGEERNIEMFKESMLSLTIDERKNALKNI